jgi:hypothetical protein
MFRLPRLDDYDSHHLVDISRLPTIQARPTPTTRCKSTLLSRITADYCGLLYLTPTEARHCMQRNKIVLLFVDAD